MVSKSLTAASLKPLVLSLLARQDSYGYEIIQTVQDLTDGEVRWTTGTLYPLLHGLENDRLVESYWKDAESGPPRRFYRLTKRGAAALETERRDWLRLHHALTGLWNVNPGLATG